jgi:hypothetical protein
MAIRVLVERERVDAVLIHVRDADYVPSSDDLRNLAIEYLSFLGRHRLAVVVQRIGLIEVARRVCEAGGVARPRCRGLHSRCVRVGVDRIVALTRGSRRRRR